MVIYTYKFPKKVSSIVPQLRSKHGRFHVETTHQDYRFRLWRLHDDEYPPLRRGSQALREDSLEFALVQRSSDLGLAEIFVGLSALLGDSGRYFDDYKGSFSFPLLLVLEKGEVIMAAITVLIRLRWKASAWMINTGRR